MLVSRARFSKHRPLAFLEALASRFLQLSTPPVSSITRSEVPKLKVHHSRICQRSSILL